MPLKEVLGACLAVTAFMGICRLFACFYLISFSYEKVLKISRKVEKSLLKYHFSRKTDRKHG